MTHASLPSDVLAGLMVATAAMALLPVVRLVRGPTIVDRAVAFDLLALLVLAIACLESLRSGRSIFLDAAVVLAIITFAATVAIAQFVERQPRERGAKRP